MALATMIENINKARREYENELDALGGDAGKAVGEFLGKAIPTGFYVTWRQYTPYFNDGDPCIFRVSEPFLVREDVADIENEDDDQNSIELGYDNYGEPDREVESTREDGSPFTYTRYGTDAIEGLSREAYDAVSEAWGQLSDDLLKKAFGDHVTVTVHQDGTAEIDDYNHD